MKTAVVEWREFFSKGAGAPQGVSKMRVVLPVIVAIVEVAATGTPALADVLSNPDAVTVVAPATESGWDKAKHALMNILDYTCWGVIVYAGTSWMFNHRTKAIDMLLSAGIGYVIVRHADDIEHFFGGI